MIIYLASVAVISFLSFLVGVPLLLGVARAWVSTPS